ncbi:hypothetical protein SAMN05661080_04499 [Modestobacter sp. DSM 44400]|uniref:hypothetical protein n=1 Tax=Modestobacter sp. DSM 44400 TaxID=1550230 RepID=UPI00089B5B8B|nr:hypothetical protein [Modestobacter sp. DSM 44400]SDY75388.1 hypothetical protein SAMN05661080_04499 [Modestobacter sp. DSM 44400]
MRIVGDLLATPVTSRNTGSLTLRPGLAARLPHVHLFSRRGDDPFSSASLYACRCGVVRPGM